MLTPTNMSRSFAWKIPAAVLCSMLLPASMVMAQAVASGAIQSVRSGINQGVHATIARGPGGERAGTGGYATSQTSSRVITGKVAGYGERQSAGRLSEYESGGRSSFGGNGDFPDTDFVATMPKPIFGAYAAPAGLGVSLSAGSSHGASPARTFSTGSHGHRQMKDPDAIMNPFTHSIGAGLGSSIGGTGTGTTVLGAGKSH